MSAPAGLAGVDRVAAALERGAPVDEVLDLVDEVIESATAEGATTTLLHLATLLDDASLARADGRGFAVAATRARAAASTLPAMLPEPEEVPEPEGPPVATVRYAGWWRRVGAFVLDWVVLLVGTVWIAGESDGEFVVGVFVVPIAYFAGLHAYAHGRTIGKWVLGIAVRGADGGAVGLGAALGRAVLQCLLWITLVGGIADSLLPLGDARRRTIHDHAARTVVVRVR